MSARPPDKLPEQSVAPFGVVPRPPGPRSERAARAAAALGLLRTRQRRLVQRLERSFPTLYDARHAAAGIGRALGPLFAAPLIALLAAVVAWLGIEAPSIDLPSVDLPDVSLPDIPFPELEAPGWLKAIGAVLELLGAASKYLVVAFAVLIGLKRTRDQRRRRAAAEAVGRPELLRRLAGTLATVEASGRARGATSVGDVSGRRSR